MRIQHNIMAMNAYRNYNTNTSALSKNLEKLSSGYKINRAGDDAAGLAISEKMRAQITGLNAAQKNVKDGVSLVKTAEGAMQEIQDMLNRMDYLATQSANGTYDDPVDRMNLNKEVDALKSEINRIADSANFNGIKLLDGSLMDTRVVGKQVSVSSKEEITLISDAHGQFHKAGVEAARAKFDVRLDEALNGVVASATITAGGSFAIKVKVGGASVTVKFTVTTEVKASNTISISNMTLKSIGTTGGGSFAANAIGADGVGSFTLTSGTAKGTFCVKVSGNTLTFELKASKTEIDFDTNLDVTVVASTNASFTVDGAGINAGMDPDGRISVNCKTQNQTKGVAEKTAQLAHKHFDLEAIADKIAVDGGVLHIGKTDIVFDVNAKGDETTIGKVGIKDLMTEDASGNLTFDKTDAKKLAELARRITRAAANDEMFSVGVGADGKTISIQEKVGFYTGDNTKDAEFLDSDSKIQKFVYTGKDASKTEGGSIKEGALVLQIGDTSESFNRLKVEIGDMHTNAMGHDLDSEGKLTSGGKSITDINIKTADAAKDAIQVIKNAINYVSSVRGDLGATQNRLEHTQNNLSVMAENIQDAESTIRDTDVAEEMMKYTKNNILIQSAQAMLAQANAVPQGVLQLLG